MKLKQVIVVNKQLKMPAGKMAAQVAHASSQTIIHMIDRFKDKYEKNPMQPYMIPNSDWHYYLINWSEYGYPKIVLKCDDTNQLKDIFRKAQEAKIPSYIVYDEGRTVFDGERHYTAVALGPWPSEEIDKITGDLSVY